MDNKESVSQVAEHDGHPLHLVAEMPNFADGDFCRWSEEMSEETSMDARGECESQDELSCRWKGLGGKGY
ncbi:hypothetical protein PC129_g16164 [Phytophthora cactorum]|uniref:Uncharacterized protein n=1 Tax=Phytophthora cactorum TaxID=29920 RepID=A0A8T1BCU3_9STRA|nr:hypothetical protein Pcac1_g21006 [Phytophthora cactorum]KAG2898725.1 hypothetical protein PC117_g22454 [Phytophthora cactorum]KAG2981132.1 hypothetical protein PC119_g21098 [Phytophthora cactorum]KAG3014668.1 hypothetical protein PC120_g12569 [Phytophthora cactorum]KAG3132296.1 hypothetical protein C6341_g22976 [Phytophthora cactorum]